MAYTFGAATTDLVSWSANITSLFTTNRSALIACWVRPTTLTATRKIWSAGTVWTLQIDTTTSSCRLTADAVTDGAFTFPAGLTVGQWTWICVIVNCGTGPTMDVNAWTATETSMPVKQTVTVATAPVGAFTTSGLVFGVGNTTTTPTTAFQGDIGGVYAHAENASSFAGPLGIISDGATTQAELDRAFIRFIDPLWRGDLQRIAGQGFQAVYNPTAGSAMAGAQVIASLDGGPWSIKPAVNVSPLAATVAGATISTRTSPHTFGSHFDNIRSHQRRGGRTMLVGL